MNNLLNIKKFLDGKEINNDEFKYIVNVEADPNNNYAECVIHKPNSKPYIKNIHYTPFVFIKDLEENGINLYEGQPSFVQENYFKSYGISIKKLNTGNQDRLKNGYVYKVTSSVSLNAIHNYFSEGGLNRYKKLYGEDGKVIRDEKGKIVYPNKNFFFAPTPVEQFFISTGCRLYNGFEDYSEIHKLIFDIETNGLNYNVSRVFAIGVKDNRGFEVTLTAKKLEDDEAERELIRNFFKVVTTIQPAIIAGYNSENFDFDFILGRAVLLGIDISTLRTTLKLGTSISRRKNTSVKYGNTSEKYTSTNMWGFSVVDIIHAVKRTAAINSDIKEFKLKYIAKLEDIAKQNRTYIKGEDGSIYNFYKENKTFVCDEYNNYLQVPDKFQDVARNLYLLQENKEKIPNDVYKQKRVSYYKESPEFIDWLKEIAIPKNMTKLISGKRLTKQYLLDDLWETDEIDNLYSQTSFMLAKIVPTTYHRICTMGTAGVWNLLLATWSYENDIAIPYTEDKSGFSGGLARTFYIGYAERWSKIDFASLYPMLQLTHDIFPMFDITGVIKQMLFYLTTTRNIYKKLASNNGINENEIDLLKLIDHETYYKYINNTITDKDRAKFKIKQLPIKILNNSLFGALGSGVAFNWSDNISAARITCLGRLYLRQTIKWFSEYGCKPLLAVTDGINFELPKTTNVFFNDNEEYKLDEYKNIDEVWSWGDKKGISALINKFNDTILSKEYNDRKSYMSVDNDGDFISCYNLARINYASKSSYIDKKTGKTKIKIKLTGNTIKSKTMPGYIEEFIDKGLRLILDGDGVGFVNYYQEYAQKIYYNQIPLKAIATKNKIKNTISEYLKRGKDKNGKQKAKQAHMELLIEQRNKIAEKIFQEQKHNLLLIKNEEDLTINDKLKLISKYMPPEPEKDTYVYQVNCGTKISDGNSSMIVDSETGEKRIASKLISQKDLDENPDMIGEYNTVKYLDSFNKRVKSLLVGFDPDVAKRILVKEKKVKTKGVDGKNVTNVELVVNSFTDKELMLKTNELDSLDDTMFLEKKEIDFWNKTGYDPRIIWDGFKVPSDYPIYYEIYDFKLNYVNKKMEEVGKPKVKSVNDKIEKNDLVLIKNDDEYYLGKHNGIFVAIVKKIENLPLCETEIKINEEIKKNEEKIENISIVNIEKTEKENEIEMKKILFEKFKQTIGLPKEMGMLELFKVYEGSEESFNMFVANQNNKEEINVFNEYDDADYD